MIKISTLQILLIFFWKYKKARLGATVLKINTDLKYLRNCSIFNRGVNRLKQLKNKRNSPLINLIRFL